MTAVCNENISEAIPGERRRELFKDGWKVIINPLYYKNKLSMKQWAGIVAIFAELIARRNQHEVEILIAYFCGIAYGDMRFPELMHHEQEVIDLIADIKIAYENLCYDDFSVAAALNIIDAVFSNFDDEEKIMEKIHLSFMQTKALLYFCKLFASDSALTQFTPPPISIIMVNSKPCAAHAC